jgi:hypothetical protein
MPAMLLPLLLVLAAAPKADPRLVGSWQLNGQPFVTLNANGKGTMEDGPITWGVDGATLVIIDEDGEAERLPFTLAGEQLTVKSEGMPLTLSRGGAAVKKAGAVARAAEKAQAKGDDADAEALAEAQAWLVKQQGGQVQVRGPGTQVQAGPAGVQVRTGQAAPAPQRAGNDQLSRLLLSSNWCWLRYSNGNSYTQKVHFSPDGTWQDFSESDIYSNNQYTQTTAQLTGNRQGGGQWAVRNGQLFLSTPESPQLAPVPLTITQNSNGYPIINADGREYSQCN